MVKGANRGRGDGTKDFSELIARAKECKAPEALEEGKIVAGFAHNQVVALAPKIVELVKEGKIRKFVVISPPWMKTSNFSSANNSSLT